MEIGCGTEGPDRGKMQEATMHRLLVRATVCGVRVLGLGAGPASAASWADGLFAEKGHDFGPIPRGAKVRHDFLLTNRLAEPLSIVHIRASCGCTSGRSSASQVAPGQSA